VTFRCVEKFKLNVPAAHMEERATLLVLRVAQMFSREPPFRTGRADELVRTIACRPTDESGAAQVREIRRRIAGWKNSGACVVGIALGANSETRKWPTSYFVETARELCAIGPVRVLFIGGPDDRAEAAQACRALDLDPAIHSACGLVLLEDLGQVLEPLDLFIGNNTGSTHFAGKVGVRTIAVFAGTHHPREWGPVGQNASWIRREEPCSPCYLAHLKQCWHGHACMANLLPADVVGVAAAEVRAVLRAGATAEVCLTPPRGSAPGRRRMPASPRARTR
jgi:ADP-heptose:LPS heptosyltransferase